MTKRNYGLMFKTDGRTVHIDFNEKMIKKAGSLDIFLDETNTAHFSLDNWHIAGKKRFKRLRKLFGKPTCGILIDGDKTSIVIEGKNNDKIKTIK